MTVGEVLTIYGDEHAPTVKDPARIAYGIQALIPILGELPAGNINGQVCRLAETKKRQPPVPLPRQLLAHLRRWEREGGRYVVEFRGQRCGHVKSAWKRALDRAGIEHCTRHDLRHTSITWAMYNGMDRWDAAGYFGVTMDTLERVYAHHHPDYLQGAVEAMERKPNLYGRTDSRGLKAF